MNKISTYRKQLGLSQRQLAVQLGCYEANFRTPGLEECRKIVSTLNRLGAHCGLDDVFPPPDGKHSENSIGAVDS